MSRGAKKNLNYLKKIQSRNTFLKPNLRKVIYFRMLLKFRASKFLSFFLSFILCLFFYFFIINRPKPPVDDLYFLDVNDDDLDIIEKKKVAPKKQTKKVEPKKEEPKAAPKKAATPKKETEVKKPKEDFDPIFTTTTTTTTTAGILLFLLFAFHPSLVF